MCISRSIRRGSARVVPGPAVFPPTLLNPRIMICNKAFQTFPGSFVRKKRDTMKTPAVSFRTSTNFFENEHVLQFDKYSGSGATSKKEKKERKEENA